MTDLGQVGAQPGAGAPWDASPHSGVSRMPVTAAQDARDGLDRRAVPRTMTGDIPLRRRRWARIYVRWAVGLDLLAGAVAATIALVVRLGGGELSLRYFGPAEISGRYVVLSAISPVLWVAAVWWAGGYQRRRLGTGGNEFRALVRASLGLLALIGFASYATKGEIARWYVVIEMPTMAVLSLMLRDNLRRWLRRQRASGRCLERTVVVGPATSAAELISQIGRTPDLGMEVVAACLSGLDADAEKATSVAGVPALHYPADAIAAVDLFNAEVVAVSSHPELAGQELRRFAWALEERDVDLIVAPGILEVAGSRLSIRPSTAGLSLLHVERPEMSGARRLLKSALDRSVTFVALAAAMPLLLLIAMAVRLESHGPAFYRQVRVGERGEEFTMLKFRTMVSDADRIKASMAGGQEVNKRLFKLRDDPRVTRVGRVLRRYSLDELPQLFNVLQGTMSLVGPRPSLPDEVAEYERDETRRLRVRPGLTGLWQVSGRSDLSWEESLRLDLWYVDNWSPVLDMQIVARTAQAVVKGRGAY